jgi:hypothetical protein
METAMPLEFRYLPMIHFRWSRPALRPVVTGVRASPLPTGGKAGGHPDSNRSGLDVEGGRLDRRALWRRPGTSTLHPPSAAGAFTSARRRPHPPIR